MANTLNFFDPSLIERWGSAFIREDKIDESVARLIPNARITKGNFTYPGSSELRDLVWNHMDQNHRPFIHRTYGDAARVFIGENAAFSLTRFGNWPVVIPVFDGYFKNNGFYQILTLFGVILVINIIECNPNGKGGTQMDISWAIASHRLLRFLHTPLHKRLHRLNDIQNREDDQMRDRRITLRAQGYRFATDDPNFINSNVVANNVQFPALEKSANVRLAELPEGTTQTIDVGDRSYLVKRVGDTVEIYPGVCPHEGAALMAEDVADRKVKCRWHGLEFPARRIAPGSGGVTVCGARVQLADGSLRIEPPNRSFVNV